jgi:hypothetical protein
MAFIKALSSTELSPDQRVLICRVTARGGRNLSAMLSARDVALVTLKVTPALTRELHSAPALLKELRSFIAILRRARRPTVPVGSMSLEESVSKKLLLQQRARRRVAAELAVSGGSLEPAAKPQLAPRRRPRTLR